MKDRDRVGEPLGFPAGTTQAELRTALTEALERDRCRRNQKKAGELFLDTTFNAKLKSAKANNISQNTYISIKTTLGRRQRNQKKKLCHLF